MTQDKRFSFEVAHFFSFFFAATFFFFPVALLIITLRVSRSIQGHF